MDAQCDGSNSLYSVISDLTPYNCRRASSVSETTRTCSDSAGASRVHNLQTVLRTLLRLRTPYSVPYGAPTLVFIAALGIRIVRLPIGLLGDPGDACKRQCGRVASRGFGIFHFPFPIFRHPTRNECSIDWSVDVHLDSSGAT